MLHSKTTEKAAEFLKMNYTKTVLVTDAHRRIAVPIVRSLGKQGVKVIAGDSTRWCPSFYSKYCSKKYVYPDALKTPGLFIEWLISHAKKGVFDVLFPLTDLTMTSITQHLNELSKHMIVPVVDHATYMKAHDKFQSILIAQNCGISCPKTLLPDSPADIFTLTHQFSGPVVIKPRMSSGARGIVYVKDKEKLYSKYQVVNAEYPRPMLQEFIPSGGSTYGVEVLMNKKSEPRAVFVHRRIREYPVSGGPSTLRESVIRPDLVEMAVNLLKTMGWYGVAMVEFKVDPRNETPLFMEVNPRFWGSIALSIVSGIDFPYLLYKLSTNGDVVPVFNYPEGIRCRWLLPGDILHFLRNPNRFKLEPSFFQFKAPNLYDDLIDRDDLGPLWGLLLNFFSRIGNPNLWEDLFFRGRMND